MALIVQKYGGSSLRTPAHIRAAAARIKSLRDQGFELVIVVSAMGRMTDYLIRLAKRTVKRPPQRELDMLMTAGERVSMSLLAMCLQEIEVPAISFTGSQSGIVTTSDHTDARIIDIRCSRITEELKKNKVVIVAGFQGVSQEREITTLGRGGSDTTAVALAAALKAVRCEVLTDVDGLFTLDPRLSSRSRLISQCSYDEAIEFSSLGAKMHARSLELAKRFSVRVQISSSSALSNRGTVVCATEDGELMESTDIRGIATKPGYHFFRVRTRLPELFAMLKGKKTALRFLHGSESELVFLCEAHRADEIRDCLQSVVLEEKSGICTVSAVGDGVGSAAHVLPAIAEVLTATGATSFLLASNSLSVTVAVAEAHRGEVARHLHERLVECSQIKKSPSKEGLSVTEASLTH